MTFAFPFRIALAALALAPALASAVDPLDPPLPPPPAAAGQSLAPAVGAVRLAGTLGFDLGFTKLIAVEMSDGSTRSLEANQGFFVSIGAAFLPLLDGRLETQATLGLKYSGIEASNGSASYLTFPLEVLELVHVSPLRLGAGVVYVHRPAASGDGALADFDVKFESSLGMVLQAEWTWRARPGAPLIAMGPRLLWQKMQVRGGGPVIDANALGFVMSFTGG
jgi:hypothetical protein